MKILFITTGYLPVPAYKGGAVNALLDQYLAYNKKDEITVYSIGDNKDHNYKEKNIEYRYIYKNTFSKLSTIFIGCLNQLPFINIRRPYIGSVIKDIYQKNESKKYDYIVLENTPKSIPYLNKKLTGKLVLHLHNDYLNTTVKYRKKIIDKCYKIICVSGFIKSRVDEVIENNKTLVVYNGIDFNKFKNSFDKKELRKKYNIDPKKKVILYVGRLLKKKGIFELIKAFIKVNDENAVLLLVGDGKLKIKRKIKYYSKINKNIILLDYIDNSKISEVYSLADIGVVPSRTNEAFGLTVIEGLSCNLKMIVSNDGAIPELVIDQDVILVDKDNLENELYTSITELLKNGFSKKSNNLDSLSKRFNIEKHVKEIDKVFK